MKTKTTKSLETVQIGETVNLEVVGLIPAWGTK